VVEQKAKADSIALPAGPAASVALPHGRASDTKRCRRCEESKPLGEFGLCNARADKLNLYCKLCIRQKIAKHRQDLREFNARIALLLRKLSPANRVLGAIRLGAETQTEIARVTKLSKDEVGAALASLLLWRREIVTRTGPRRLAEEAESDGQRKYFLADGSARPVDSSPAPREPRSFGVSTIYFDGEPAIACRAPRRAA
jgi:hypothetical protein